MSETITSHCWACGRENTAPSDMAGAAAKCECGMPYTVPTHDGGAALKPKDKERPWARRLPRTDLMSHCPACGDMTSTRARACPHCGHPIEPKPFLAMAVLGAIGALAILSGVHFAFTGLQIMRQATHPYQEIEASLALLLGAILAVGAFVLWIGADILGRLR